MISFKEAGILPYMIGKSINDNSYIPFDELNLDRTVKAYWISYLSPIDPLKINDKSNTISYQGLKQCTAEDFSGFEEIYA